MYRKSMRMSELKKLSALAFALFLTMIAPGISLAQGTNVAFGSLSHDTGLPVEITADQLEINQADGTAAFVGNVIIGQGEMRLLAESVRVEYASGDGDVTGKVERLIASGGVTLVNGDEAAEAREATYTISTGLIIMSGGVIMTQGRNALSADRMIINLNAGTGQLEGRVKTIIQTGGN